MFGKYNANTEVQAAALNNGINVLLTELETVNSDYDVLYKKRLAEGAVQPDESASEQKSEVCNSYTQFCNIIEQAVNFTPKESVLTLFKNMDELRKTYHAMMPNGKDKLVEEPVKTGE
jgi:hypothetical protein